jgi:leucyl aminopeptidase (aminopeptidase T)
MESAMQSDWAMIARGWVRGLNVQHGELIQVRNDTERFDILQEVLLAIEAAGATPLLELTPIAYLERLLAEVPVEHLARWDQHRKVWMQQIDRILFLGGAHPDFSRAPRDARDAWQGAWDRLTEIEEGRRLPFLLIGLPTLKRAQQSNMTLEELEAILLPALGASVEELQREIERALDAIGAGRTLIVRSGQGHELRLDLGDRIWLRDDGLIDERDREQGSIVSNLPAGSIYTTVIENATQGSIRLPKAGVAQDVVFYFEQGRLARIEARSGADELNAMFDRHSGEPRRVSHIGIGLNPHLHQAIDWVLVDEHIHGALFLALGENRYMGGQNESSLNVDYVLTNPTVMTEDRVVVDQGRAFV